MLCCISKLLLVVLVRSLVTASIVEQLPVGVPASAPSRSSQHASTVLNYTVDFSADLKKLLEAQTLDKIATNNSLGIWVSVRAPNATASVALGYSSAQQVHI